MRRLIITATVLALVTSVLSWPAGPADASQSTTYTWQGGNGYSWGTENNWFPPGHPRDGDTVQIQANTGSCANAHITDVPTISLNTLTVSDAGDNSGTCYASLDGGQITVTSKALLDGGVYRTPLVVASGAVAGVHPSHPTHPVFDARVDVQGELVVTAATGESSLIITSGHTLHIAKGGELDSVGDTDLRSTACCATPAHVTNSGTLTAAYGTVSDDGVELDQLGTLDTPHGGSVVSRNAPVTTHDGSTYTGNGSWHLEQVVTAHFVGVQHLGRDFHLMLGADYGGTPPATSEALGGLFTLAGKGTFDWQGGTIEGNATIGHDVTVVLDKAHADNDRRFLWGHDTTLGKTPAPAAKFTNHGTVVFTHRADLYTEYAARLVNAKDGMLTLGAGSVVSAYTCCADPDRLTNVGRIQVKGSAIGKLPVVLHALDLRQTAGDLDLGIWSRFTPQRGIDVSGGTLSGTGTLTGDVRQTGGTLSPGHNGTGELSIRGAYSAGKKARLLVDVAAKGKHDHVAVSGAARVAGSMRVHDQNWTPPLRIVRRVLDAGGGTTGRYACVTTSGQDSTGTKAVHWVAQVLRQTVEVYAIRGRHTSC